MVKQDELFLKFFEDFKDRMFEYKISLEEIEQETKIDPELLTIIFDPKAEIISGIARLIKFGKFKTNYTKLKPKWYLIDIAETQLKITRTIYPKCSIRFDKKTEKYFNFKVKGKNTKISETYKQLIISEMKKYVDKNKEKIRESTYIE